MKVHDKLLLEEFEIKSLCGIDEAGRGPLCGPVVSSAVILPNNLKIEGLNDSKKLTKLKREKIYDILKRKAIIGIGIVDNKEIDKINILNATKKSMLIALYNLKQTPDLVLTDNVNINTDIPQINIVKGDQISESIAAASIIAKVTRDNIMEEYHKKYPFYEFNKHKGYPTKKHIELIKKYGPCEIHRRSYKPIKDIIKVNKA